MAGFAPPPPPHPRPRGAAARLPGRRQDASAENLTQIKVPPKADTELKAAFSGDPGAHACGLVPIADRKTNSPS